MIVSTGTGSSGLLKNVQALTLERLETIADLLGQKLPKDRLQRSLEEYNKSPLFEPTKPALHFYHRDLIDERGQKKQGQVTELYVKSLTYRPVLCCDSSEFVLSFEDELKVKVCEPSEYLTTLHINS